VGVSDGRDTPRRETSEAKGSEAKQSKAKQSIGDSRNPQPSNRKGVKALH